MSKGYIFNPDTKQVTYQENIYKPYAPLGFYIFDLEDTDPNSSYGLIKQAETIDGSHRYISWRSSVEIPKEFLAAMLLLKD